MLHLLSYCAPALPHGRTANDAQSVAVVPLVWVKPHIGKAVLTFALHIHPRGTAHPAPATSALLWQLLTGQGASHSFPILTAQYANLTEMVRLYNLQTR